MDGKIVLPDTSLQKLKCSACKGFLSVPPVDLSTSTCGRCNTGGRTTPAFEELAKFMIFPCIYPKCTEKIAWGNVEKHELKCIHKTTLCPVQGCEKIIKITSTLSHFQQYHKKNIHQKSFTISEETVENNQMRNSNRRYDSSYNSLDSQVYLITYNNLYFLVLVHKNLIKISQHYNSYVYDYDYTVGIFCMNQTNTENIKYEFTLTLHYNETMPVSYTKKDLAIPVFNERKHCFKCAYTSDSSGTRAGTCSTKYHKKDKFLTTNFEKVDRSGRTKQSYEIKLYSCSDTRQTKNPPILNKLSKKLECPICTEYMCAPIYSCPTGHTICKECKPKLPVCPFCQTCLGNSRNFALEEISETLEVPCYHASEGCQFTGLTASIKDHKQICAFDYLLM